MRAALSEKNVRSFNLSVPFVSVATADSLDFCISLPKVFEGINDFAALVQWDVVRGITGLNKAGVGWIASLSSDENSGENNEPVNANDSVGFLENIRRLPDGSVAIMHLANRWLGDDSRATIQAALLLRNLFKSKQCMLIFLSHSITLPPELREDVMVFDEPLPSPDELGSLVDTVYTTLNLKPNKEDRSKAIDYTIGLSKFGAEQALYLSARKSGIDVNELRENRHKLIEQTPGLSVYRGKETFADVAGIPYIKNFFTRVANGNRKPLTYIHVDEIEKAFAASGSDSTGVSQDILNVVLQHMEDNRSNGLIALGPPGCSKSLIAKAVGGNSGVDTIQLDLGGLKDKHVGQSENNIRQALKVIKAMSNGREYWVATCNSLSELPAPLIRRFTHGIVFFDLPSIEERKAIWKVQIAAHKLTPQQTKVLPTSDRWSGAEIRNCCALAWEFGCTLVEAAKDIIPVAVSNPNIINSLCKTANGRFKSASTGEVYVSSNVGNVEAAAGERKINLS